MFIYTNIVPEVNEVPSESDTIAWMEFPKILQSIDSTVTNLNSVISYESDLSQNLYLSIFENSSPDFVILRWYAHYAYYVCATLSYIFSVSLYTANKNILNLYGFIAAENLILLDRH